MGAHAVPLKLREVRCRPQGQPPDFAVENGKTILVGPNEAGKTVILQALQQLNRPKEIGGFEALRDYPRSEYDDIKRGVVDPAEVTVAEGHFAPEQVDMEGLPKGYESCTYVLGRNLDNSAWHRINGGPTVPTYGTLSKDLTRLSAHVDARKRSDEPAPGAALAAVTSGWTDSTIVNGDRAAKLKAWLESALPLIDEANKAEDERYNCLRAACSVAEDRAAALKCLEKRIPVFERLGELVFREVADGQATEVQNDIIRKLSNERAEPVQSERRVVYFLVELRKLMAPIDILYMVCIT